MTEVRIDEAGQPLCLRRVTLKATKAGLIICYGLWKTRTVECAEHTDLWSVSNHSGTLPAGHAGTTEGGGDTKKEKKKRSGERCLPRGDICREQHSSLTPYVCPQ